MQEQVILDHYCNFNANFKINSSNTYYSYMLLLNIFVLYTSFFNWKIPNNASKPHYVSKLKNKTDIKKHKQ